jgi:hypothetical protein
MRTVIVEGRSRAGALDGTYGARFALARAVAAITSVVVGLIVVAIALIVLEANPSNDIVAWVVDAGRWLVGPFHDLFRLDGDWRTIVNWGLAALVYSFIGRLLAGFFAR